MAGCRGRRSAGRAAPRLARYARPVKGRIAPRRAWLDTAFDWAGGPVLPLEPGEAIWLPAPEAATLPAEGVFTLTVRARLSAASDPGATWGIWVAAADGSRIVWAISGEQYVTTRRCPASAAPGGLFEDCPALRPEWRWFPYPRVALPGATNALTLHRERPGAVRLRINREQMGLAEVTPTGTWGVWARGGRTTAASLVWERAELRIASD